MRHYASETSSMAKIRQSILIVLIVLLYAATIPLASYFSRSFSGKQKEPDILQNIFGGMRSFVSEWAFIKAEEYHHRGLPFMETIKHHGGGSALLNEASGIEEHHHSEEEEEKGFFSRVRGTVKVTGHSHLSAAQDKEVLPWFYTEVMFNPHDIRGYVLGGYWLVRMGRYEESMKFLKEGEKNNPDSAQILTSIAKLYHHDGRDEDAISYLEKARALWLKAAPPNSIINQYMESDREETFDLLGHFYEEKGQYEKALEAYSQLPDLKQFPRIKEKIAELRNMIKAGK